MATPRDPDLIGDLAESRLRTGDRAGAEQASAAAYALRRGSQAATRGYATSASGATSSLLTAKADRFLGS